MKVSDLVRELNLTVFCGEAGLDAEISGGYTSDLLSDVMGHIDEGMLWVTMQTHQNIVAVATLKDVAAFCNRHEGVPGRFAPAHLSFALRKLGDEPAADCGNGPRTGIGCHCCDGS